MTENDNILVIGSNGFLGKNIVNYLNRKNYKNVYCYFSKFKISFNYNSLKEYLDNCKIKYVINCAAKVGGIQANIKDPFAFLMDNLIIQNTIIQATLNCKFVQNCIMLGSSCIYPSNYTQPLKEEYLLASYPEKTNEGYAISKICGLKLCEYANNQNENKFISLMPANLYGPMDHFDLTRSHVISSLIHKMYESKLHNYPTVEIFGTGTPKREFLYVEDLCNCIEWSMDNLKDYKSFLNVGTGIDISIYDLAITIKEIIGYNGELYFNKNYPDGMMERRLDVSKINNLGWSAKTSLSEGLQKTIKWYMEVYCGQQN